jgi:LTXXQ motif family protein
MSFVSARATRTAIIVIALSGAGIWGLRAMDARADPPPQDDSSPCAEGRALFAAKLAYLEAKISPEPSQEEAWRSFAGAMRASAGEVDRACVEDSPRPLSADAGQRRKRMDRHAAAMQAMFGAMADAYVAVAPNLTEAQRDILSRNIVPSRPFAARFLSGKGPRPGDMARNCGPGEPGSQGSAQP